MTKLVSSNNPVSTSLMKTLMLALVLLSVPSAVFARPISFWSYRNMLKKADLVVIAQPTETKQTFESATLPNFAPDVHVIGVETAFKIYTTLKGDEKTKTLVLHHYRLANPRKQMLEGPALVGFNPKESRSFLLFLVREHDGRYAPVSGQTDPGSFSVLGLTGVAQ